MERLVPLMYPGTGIRVYPRRLPVTHSARSRRSYWEIRDCEQSTETGVLVAVFKLTKYNPSQFKVEGVGDINA